MSYSCFINPLISKANLERAKMMIFIQNGQCNFLSDLKCADEREEHVKLNRSTIKHYYEERLFSRSLSDIKNIKHSVEMFRDEVAQYKKKCDIDDVSNGVVTPEGVSSSKQIERKTHILALFEKYKEDFALLKETESKLLKNDSLTMHQKHSLTQLLSMRCDRSDTQLLSTALEAAKSKLEQIKDDPRAVLNLKKITDLLETVRGCVSDLTIELDRCTKERERAIKQNKLQQHRLGDTIHNYGDRLKKLASMQAILLSNEKSRYTFFAEMLSVAVQKR
jgi:hypothetical protein